MERAEVIRINEGNHIQVDLGDFGYRIDGPLTIIKTCVMCGTTHEIRVKTADYRRWRQGAYIQDAMPYLTANEREILMSGICSTCFDALYPEEEELVLT